MALPFAATRVLFFTGKGGVGKTSLACATAVALADAGRRVLLVSTDPASNLDEVLETRLSGAPTPVTGVERLWALNIDPGAAAAAYRDNVIGPLRGVMPPSLVGQVEEQLSGACTTEIAVFDRFTRLLGDDQTTAAFDHVIFDTAPTGHTLRLLKLPAAWDGFLATNTSGTSCLGPLAGLQSQRALYQASVAALSDPAQTTILLVSRPERSALAEAERTRRELAALGVLNQRLLVNGVFTAAMGDAVAQAYEQRATQALARMPEALGALPRHDVPLHDWAPMGVLRLRALLKSTPAPPQAPTSLQPLAANASLADLADSIEAAGRGVVMTMGKGGVGKTTIAAALAVELARRGLSVHLTTTDPAAHVLDVLPDAVTGVHVTRIDPEIETASYSAEVMATTGADLDEQGRALLEEDLRSPCTEEVAVFRAFARVVAGGSREVVIIDTAPTGHTLLLLDAARAYHREIQRTHATIPDSVADLLSRLRDPTFTRILLVTLPEATPIHEAATLEQDLRRAGMTPFAWVINQSFAATATTDPALIARGNREHSFIAEVANAFPGATVIVPWQTELPRGAAALLTLAHAGAPYEPQLTAAAQPRGRS